MYCVFVVSTAVSPATDSTVHRFTNNTESDNVPGRSTS